MAENEAATRDYVVLRCSQEAKPAPRPSGDSATGDVEALKPTPEQWEIVDTVAARSDSEARKIGRARQHGGAQDIDARRDPAAVLDAAEAEGARAGADHRLRGRMTSDARSSLLPAPRFCEKCGASDFSWRDHRGCSICFQGPFLGPVAQAQMDWLFGVRRV
jgi:hypothetical protein